MPYFRFGPIGSEIVTSQAVSVNNSLPNSLYRSTKLILPKANRFDELVTPISENEAASKLEQLFISYFRLCQFCDGRFSYKQQENEAFGGAYGIRTRDLRLERAAS